MTDLIVRSSSGGLAVNNGPSVLGEQQAKIPVGGKIKPGIKVLTATGKAHAKAQSIYDAGVAAGHSWATIEQNLMKECGFEKSPLTPKNVRYFSVFRSDFDNPAAADQIMEKYGEVVDGVRRLIRFPIMFPTDSWQANLPHGLNCYTRSELQFWSSYDANGNRLCLTRKPVEAVKGNERAHRQFGGRPTIPRPDTNGVCNPDVCPQYQARACNLTAQLLFFIPGISGGAAISLPFKSFYGMEQARTIMAMVAYVRQGRISGLHEGKPIFYISKKLSEVPMLDPKTGEPKRVKQWILTIDADMDMLTVFQNAEAQRALALDPGAAAAAALSSPPLQDAIAHDDDDPDDFIEHETDAEDDAPPPPPPPPPTVDDAKAAIGLARQAVHTALKELDIVPSVFSAWMVKKTGIEKWSYDPDGLKSAIEYLQQCTASGNVAAWKFDNGLDAPF